MTKPMFLKTSAMAARIGRSKDWLKRRKGTTFTLGVHYHRPPGESEDFWDVAAMERWIRGQEMSETAKGVMEAVLQ